LTTICIYEYDVNSVAPNLTSIKFRFVEQVLMATYNQNSHKQQQQSRSYLATKCKAKPQSNQRINKIKRV